mgnify:CR=1 FL=1
MKKVFLLATAGAACRYGRLSDGKGGIACS